MRFVIVEWLDAYGPIDLEPGQSHGPKEARTAGWVHEDEPGHITLAPEVFDDLHRACTVIPRGCITRITEIEGA